jgi:hypothetical protein
MDVQDDTEALRKFLAQSDPENDLVESVHRAEVDASTALTVMANPKAALKAMGVPVSDASMVNVSMKSRADRSMNNSLVQSAAMARFRRIIIIVVHWRNCDADIFILAS